MGYVLTIFLSSSVYGWTSTFLLDVPRLSSVIGGEIEPFSAMLAQGGLAECHQPVKIFMYLRQCQGIVERPDSLACGKENKAIELLGSPASIS